MVCNKPTVAAILLLLDKRTTAYLSCYCITIMQRRFRPDVNNCYFLHTLFPGSGYLWMVTFAPNNNPWGCHYFHFATARQLRLREIRGGMSGASWTSLTWGGGLPFFPQDASSLKPFPSASRAWSGAEDCALAHEGGLSPGGGWGCRARPPELVSGDPLACSRVVRAGGSR